MGDEKPFDASPSRLARAKREGDLPRSTDVNVVASVGFAALALAALLDPIAGAASAAFRAALSPHEASPWPYVTIAASALAVCVAALAGALVGTFGQSRTLVVKAPTPSFDKLHPLQGLKRMLSRDAFVGGAKALVVSLVVTASASPAVADALAASASASSPNELAALVARALGRVVASALVAAALFAAGDIVLERAKWKKRLKMSFDELKRDHKASDGDPLVRGRRRRAHRALVRGSIGRVREAAFVVTNPTHIAIALEYHPPDCAVPRVLVRALDDGANEVKRLARRWRVPIVENVVLARALLASTDVGEYIPADVYGAVAAIVASLVRSESLA
ncbi:MAG: hypothetical protein NVSMB21_09980 [Vulcanimicrobiaceae bacterium]